MKNCFYISKKMLIIYLNDLSKLRIKIFLNLISLFFHFIKKILFKIINIYEKNSINIFK
jgi:hypothetical protein